VGWETAMYRIMKHRTRMLIRICTQLILHQLWLWERRISNSNNGIWLEGLMLKVKKGIRDISSIMGMYLRNDDLNIKGVQFETFFNYNFFMCKD
jgi:hypothetical protein